MEGWILRRVEPRIRDSGVVQDGYMHVLSSIVTEIGYMDIKI